MCPKPKRSAGWAPGQEPLLFKRTKLGLVALVVTSLPIGSFFALFNSVDKSNEMTASPSPRPSVVVTASPSPSPTKASPSPSPTKASPTPTRQVQVLAEFTPTPSPITASPAARVAQPSPTINEAIIPTPEPTANRKDESNSSTAVGAEQTSASAKVPSGLSGATESVRTFAAVVNARWPGLVYGGLRPGDPQDHGTGHAVDIMVSGDKGWEIAHFAQENASKYGIKYIIYEAKIWSAERASEGWRACGTAAASCYAGSDLTAAHYDHNHVSFY